MALAQGRQRASVVQTKSSVSDEKMDETMKAVEEIMPKLGVKPSKRLRQKMSLILSVAETHGLDNALQMLKINDAQLKGVLSQVMGKNRRSSMAAPGPGRSTGDSGLGSLDTIEGKEETSEGKEETSEAKGDEEAEEPPTNDVAEPVDTEDGAGDGHEEPKDAAGPDREIAPLEGRGWPTNPPRLPGF